MAKTLPVVWLGDADPHMQIITEAGIEFIKGRPVDVPVDHEFNGFKWMPMLKGNPMFAVGEDDAEPIKSGDDEEIAELKSMLDDLNVKYRANANVETLRTALNKAMEA